MSKTTWGVIIVIVVLVGAYMLLSKKAPEGPTGEQAQTEEKKMAFSEFVKQGGSYKCEVKQNLSDMENSGTVYLSGGMVRGDFQGIAEGQAFDSHFIFRDGTSFTWSSLMPNQGYKVSEVNTEASSSNTYSWDASQIGDYNCVAWNADASVFAVPTNITFQEIQPK